MTRASVAGALLHVVLRMTVGVALASALSGCREEPTIVIKFEPNDMSGGRTADLGARPAADLAAAPTPDLAVAKKGTAVKPPTKGAVECKVAADCVIEPSDCCDCANGGKQHAIAKKLAAASKAARTQKCKNTVCTMMLSTDPSCGQRADCVDGGCVMIKK
ncbi:MAG: hypothetical protein JWN44_5231 [Myxococcales bacterium]|nr:hypothetical protein [Myxococcales bacterium]